MNVLKVFPALAGFLVASAVVSTAHAQDQVDLLDGSSLQGHVTQQTPGSFVVIQTDDGHVQSIPWGQIKRVSTAPAAPAPVAPAAPATPAPSAPSVPAAPIEGAGPMNFGMHPPELHFEGGVRVGYSFAGGDYVGGMPIGTASESNGLAGIQGSIPLTLDAGMRISKFVYVGGFFQYAGLMSQCFTPTAGSNESATASCSGHDIRAGIDVQLHVVPRGTVDPWVGLGFGHEWLNVGATETLGSNSGTASATFDGWNMVDLMLGLDLRMQNGMAFGPYLEVSSGSYSSLNSSATAGGNTQTASGDITTKSSHQWITLGARGTFEVL